MEFKKSLKAIKKQLSIKEKENKNYITTNIQDEQVKACLCTDSNNNLKTLYPTEEEAKSAAKYSKVKLSVYPCPYVKGWHLTKR